MEAGKLKEESHKKALATLMEFFNDIRKGKLPREARTESNQIILKTDVRICRSLRYGSEIPHYFVFRPTDTGYERFATVTIMPDTQGVEKLSVSLLETLEGEPRSIEISPEEALYEILGLGLSVVE